MSREVSSAQRVLDYAPAMARGQRLPSLLGFFLGACGYFALAAGVAILQGWLMPLANDRGSAVILILTPFAVLMPAASITRSRAMLVGGAVGACIVIGFGMLLAWAFRDVH